MSSLRLYEESPKKNIKITEEFLEKHKRGIGHKKAASYYLFRRIK